MRLSTLAVPAALAVTLAAAAPSMAHTAAKAPPAAHAAGGAAGGPLTYPSLVGTRLTRTQNALDQATTLADQGDTTKAAASLNSARTNLAKAWTAAKYVIDTTPPPPPAAAGLRTFHASSFTSSRVKIRNPKGKARAAGGAPAGPAIASIYDTGFAVLTLQHATATTAVGLIDGATGPTLDAVNQALSQALKDRDTAIAYIKAKDAATPAAPAASGLKAHAAGGAVVAGGGWALVMPNVIPQLDDEVQQIEGTLAGSTTLAPATTSALQAAELQDSRAQRTVNATWPPAPAAAG